MGGGDSTFLAGPALTSFATANFAAMVPPAQAFQVVNSTVFRMGDAGSETASPVHSVALSGFSVSDPVTTDQFKKFAAVVERTPYAAFADFELGGGTRVIAIGDSVAKVRDGLSHVTVEEVLDWLGLGFATPRAFRESVFNPGLATVLPINELFVHQIDTVKPIASSDDPAWVTWRGAALYSDLVGAGGILRLPTEAQLELFARLGFLNTSPKARSSAVWTGDWYGPYNNLSASDPTGPVHGSEKVIRNTNGNPASRKSYLLNVGVAGIRLVKPGQ